MTNLKSNLLLAILITCAQFANASLPFRADIMWSRPQSAVHLAHDLKLKPLRKGFVAVEVGPGEEPLCVDCDYLDTNSQLPSEEMRERLRIGDARAIPYATQSVDFLIFKNFPWVLESNIRKNGFDITLAGINAMRVRNGAPLFEGRDLEHIRTSQAEVRQRVFAQIERVLKSDGSALILHSLVGDAAGEMLNYLSPLVEEAKARGFIVSETPNIRDHTSPRLADQNGGYGQPLGGIVITKPDSCERNLN